MVLKFFKYNIFTFAFSFYLFDNINFTFLTKRTRIRKMINPDDIVF